MKKTLPTLTAMAALVLASFTAHAMDDSKTMAAADTTMRPGAIAKGEGPAKLAQPEVGETSRADVKAEARQAVKAGKIGKGEGSPSVAKTHKGVVSKAEVKAEAAEAVKNGEIAKGPNVPMSGGVAKP
jgi:hypothetical protein